MEASTSAAPAATSLSAAVQSDAYHRYALLSREAEVLSKLQALGDEVDELEQHAHGILRVDPPSPTHQTRTALVTVDILRDRAVRRVEEWAALLGGGRVTLSQPLVLPAQSLSNAGRPPCECRREAWVVQLQAPARRVQVVAARFSALPPDGRNSQLLDVTWLDDAADLPCRAAADGEATGVPRLAALFSSVTAPAEKYEAEALAAAMLALDLPPADYAHLCTQPLLFPSVGACEPLTRCLESLGDDICAWCRLEEPLPPAAPDGLLDALRRARTPAVEQPEQVGRPDQVCRARADLAVRHWERMDIYLASALLGAAELGQRRWLATAAASLRARGAEGGEAPPATSLAPPSTPLALLLALVKDPRADAVRRQRVRQVLEWLGAAPAPVGGAILDAAEEVLSTSS